MDTIDIGIASIDITPPIGVTLSGYHPRIATSIGHPLRAEALVCGSGRSRWALLLVEVLGFPAALVRDLRAAIAAKTGIAAGRILIAATHTHSGPMTLRIDPPRDQDARYLGRLATRLVQVTVRAARQARPGRFETTTCPAPAWGHNRRIRRSDGTWANAWQDRERRHTGYFDPDIHLLAVRRPEGHLDALLVTYGCHPVTLGPQSLAISGDYVSYLKDALEEQGLARTVLFGISGHANINPPDCIRRSSSHAQRMGRALARRIRAALPSLQALPTAPATSARTSWTLQRPRQPLPGKGLHQGRSGRITTEIMALRAGEVGIVSVPGELFSEYVAWFRAASPLAQTIVLSLGNDYIGYLPTDRAAQEGAYEARMSPAPRLEKPLRRLVTRTIAATLDCSGRGRSRSSEVR